MLDVHMYCILEMKCKSGSLFYAIVYRIAYVYLHMMFSTIYLIYICIIFLLTHYSLFLYHILLYFFIIKFFYRNLK